MPNATEPTPAEQLADLLEGRLEDADVPAELVELAELASAVRTHIVPVPPTDAFREALREQVVQAASTAAGPAATSAAATTTGITTTGASSGVAALVAGVSAAAVLAASTVAVADRAGPGDLLAPVDRGIESLQLLVADDTRDVGLLVDFATERVLEALDVTDVAVVEELLADADALVADAIALAVAQGRSIDELLADYTGALLTLSSRTELPEVEAAVARRLEALGVELGSSPPLTGDVADEPVADDQSGAGEATQDDEPAADTGDVTEPVDEVTDPVDDVTDTVDDVTEPLDDVTEPLDDVTEPVDDVTDPLDDATEPLDDVTEPLDDVTDPVEDVTEPLDDATGLLEP